MMVYTKRYPMEITSNIKNWINAVTEIGVMSMALAIVATLLVGGENLPFFGTVVANLTHLIKDLGASGLSGLIALGIIIALFSRKHT